MSPSLLTFDFEISYPDTMREGGATVWMEPQEHEKSRCNVRYLTMRLRDHGRGGGYCVNGMTIHHKAMRKLMAP